MSDRKDQQARVLLATSLSYVIVILDTSIVNVALEPISASFQTGVSGLQWVVNAYTLTFACLLLTGGRLEIAWGRRGSILPACWFSQRPPHYAVLRRH